ncbi:hypothetical protein, partial [Malikia sp.]|uniref:hypothetical protein n=1 Tax=Malikia sp. TaxID=2070706 RepID=UPI00262590F7
PPGVGQLGEVGLGVGKHAFSIHPASSIAQSQIIPGLHSAIALGLALVNWSWLGNLVSLAGAVVELGQ